MEQDVSVLANCEIYTEPNFIYSFCALLCGAETLNFAPLFVCWAAVLGRFKWGHELYRIQTDSQSTHFSDFHSVANNEYLVRSSNHLRPHPVLSPCMGFLQINNAFWD
ncbi:hypothetical protein EXN66_Car008732 [Channa argus]|uniref:Uncharacterized protein n=1 Tax=Channa argus TaxID=215402 RepID=A0A6G1PSU1_CHAAH|nr:hypothetical protein EXN66_Car008732 [Channa argus]